jgi:peroxiredoxin family protein
MSDLLILAHGGSWEWRFQVSSLAASAVAGGKTVDLALFFAALDAWVKGRWDALDPAPPLDAERLEAIDAPSLYRMIAAAREVGVPGTAEPTGRLRLFACSASMRFLGLDTAAVQQKVDVIAGWQSFSKMALEAGTVVTF